MRLRTVTDLALRGVSRLRRPLAAMVPGMALAAILIGSALRSDTPHRDRDVMVVYVGAEDCAPCRAWQRGDGAAFRISAEFNQISYREVKSPTLFDVLNDDYWPEDLRVYRKALGGEAGVPLWMIIADDKVVTRHFGASQWKSSVLPRIKSLVPPI